MKKYQLGEFEEIVMLTVAILHGNAYGVPVKKEIESRLSRNVSVGALQTALARLEDKGYLRSQEGEGTIERVGRPKKYFIVTALGKRAMEYSKTTRENLWNAIPKAALNLKFKIITVRGISPTLSNCVSFLDFPLLGRWAPPMKKLAAPCPHMPTPGRRQAEASFFIGRKSSRVVQMNSLMLRIKRRLMHRASFHPEENVRVPVANCSLFAKIKF